MIETTLELGLLESLRELQLLARRLEAEAKRTPFQLRLERLEAAVQSLDAPKAARPPVGLEEYVRQWKDYSGGKIPSLEPRAIRNLCWHPETATNETFQDYLDRHAVSLGSRALQGFLRSCHARWSRELSGGNAVSQVRSRLEQYEGPSRLLARWKPACNMLLGPDGAERFGNGMLTESVPVKTFCQRWCIADEFSPYVQASVALATKVCREQMPAFREYLLTQLLPWQGWPLDRFKEEVSKTAN